jgi:hypothetical protein
MVYIASMKKDIRYLLEYFTKEQLAAKLFVSPRTIERWSEGMESKQPANTIRIHRMAENLRKKLEAE